MKEHESLVRYLAKDPFDIRTGLTTGDAGRMHAALGIAGESGEVVEVIKKSVINGKPFDRDDLINEVGDLLFYVVMLLQSIDADLQDALDANVAKLTARYPNGYSDRAAQERLDEQVD